MTIEITCGQGGFGTPGSPSRAADGLSFSVCDVRGGGHLDRPQLFSETTAGFHLPRSKRISAHRRERSSPSGSMESKPNREELDSFEQVDADLAGNDVLGIRAPRSRGTGKGTHDCAGTDDGRQ